MDSKRFSQEEVEFLYQILKELIENSSGCFIKGTNIKCPYWDLEKQNDNPDIIGNCIAKKTNKLCSKLQLPLVEESLILEVRQKNKKDYLDEVDEEVRKYKTEFSKLSGIVKKVNDEKQKIEQQLESLERKKKIITEKDD